MSSMLVANLAEVYLNPMLSFWPFSYPFGAKNKNNYESENEDCLPKLLVFKKTTSLWTIRLRIYSMIRPLLKEYLSNRG